MSAAHGGGHSGGHGGGGHAPAAHGSSGGGHAHTPASSGGHTSSGGGGPSSVNGKGLFWIVIAIIICLYIPLHKNDGQVVIQTPKKINYGEGKVDSIPFNPEFGDFYPLGAYQQLQFDPARQPLDCIDNYGHTFHVSINENIGYKIPTDLPTNYAIKLKSCNGTIGKLAYAKLSEK